ncbi:MAG: cytochrome b/b6 domain-containing protein [Desulfuromonadales bacterium]|nr:cytochrome b/b6 domain-containing protein [Desulfuromonadales bacterium]NIR33682.1 cytochrome b/b6 domain-containing protein [Desulfuromonadales bacterium]
MSNDRIARHSVAVRLVHWLFAVSGILLCISGIGFMPLYGRFYVNELPGMAWVSDFNVQMTLHYVSAALFCATLFYHIVFHWRRREFAAWPRRGDLRESWLMVRALLTGTAEPPQGKFLAEQRLAYLAIGLTSLLLVGTGLVLSWKNAGPINPDAAFVQWMTLLHLGATFFFMALVAMHLLAFVPRINRALLPTMFTGSVDRHYAEKRHALWASQRSRERTGQ